MEWTVIFLVLAVASPEKNDVAVEALSRSYQKWKDNVTFKSTYRLGMTSSDASVDIALKQGALGRISSPDRGVFIKRGATIRKSITCPPSSFIRDSTEPKPYLRVSDDMIGDNRILLTYHPKQGNFGDQALFAIAPEGSSTDDYRECSFLEISPLNPFGGCNEDPYGSKSFHKGEALTFAVRKLDASHLEVTAKSQFKKGGANEQVMSVVIWWIEPEIPVVESASRTIADRNGRVLGENQVRLEKFQKCQGGFVARRVLFAIGAWQGKGPVTVKEWLSEDLGRESPKDEDFVIRVPKSTRVTGLNNPPLPGQEHFLSIANVTTDMLLKPTKMKSASGASPNMNQGNPPATRTWTLWLSTTALIVLVTIFVLRRRRRLWAR